MKYVLKFIIAVLATLIVIPLLTILKNILFLIYDFSTENLDWHFDFTVYEAVKTSGGFVPYVYQNWFYWAFKIIK